MKLPKILLSLAALLIAGCIGWLINWYTSPLGPPLCLDTGRDYLELALSRDYIWLWLLIAAVGYVAIGVPLWILALRKRQA